MCAAQNPKAEKPKLISAAQQQLQQHTVCDLWRLHTRKVINFHSFGLENKKCGAEFGKFSGKMFEHLL
jgi:hypothetical protein